MSTIKAGDDFAATLSDDRKTARLEIMGDGQALALVDCDSEMLSACIRQMGRLRADMLPSLPRKLDPNPVFIDVTREAIVHVDRQHKVAKEFFVAFRHEGFGWLAFTLSAESGEVLMNLINRQVEGMRPIITPKKGIII
jgi:hypothetical protein